MEIVLLRIGIDSGCGGIHGPLFKDDSFDYIPIPGGPNEDRRTYGNTKGRSGRLLIEYFPDQKKNKMKDRSIHFDPEFDSFTYGDPTTPKASLRKLEKGDMIVFYCGLEGWRFYSEPALYLMGYFQIQKAGRAANFSIDEIDRRFGKNAHVRNKKVTKVKKDERLVLVRGSNQSRMLKKAVLISKMSTNKNGKPLKILSKKMTKIFGKFTEKNSIERSIPRWVNSRYVSQAAQYVRGLE